MKHRIISRSVTAIRARHSPRTCTLLSATGVSYVLYKNEFQNVSALLGRDTLDRAVGAGASCTAVEGSPSSFNLAAS
jgi:hypothetical protein